MIKKGPFKLWKSRNKGERPPREPVLHAHCPGLSRPGNDARQRQGLTRARPRANSSHLKQNTARAWPLAHLDRKGSLRKYGEGRSGWWVWFGDSGEGTAFRRGPNESHTRQISFHYKHLFRLSRKSRLQPECWGGHIVYPPEGLRSPLGLEGLAGCLRAELCQLCSLPLQPRRWSRRHPSQRGTARSHALRPAFRTRLPPGLRQPRDRGGSLRTGCRSGHQGAGAIGQAPPAETQAPGAAAAGLRGGARAQSAALPARSRPRGRGRS